MIEYIPGDKFDTSSLKLGNIPLTKEFSLFKFKNNISKRLFEVLKCESANC